MNYQHEAIANLVIQAYNAGLMGNEEPMTICGLTANVMVRARFNIMKLDTYNRTLSVHIYDSDSTELQEASIRALVIDMFN